MLTIVVLLFIYVCELNGLIPYDGIIHRSSDGSSYAFLSPPNIGNHASFIEEITPSGTLAVAWFSGGEQQPNCSIALSLLELGSQQFKPGVIVSERMNYSNQNPVLYWNNQTQVLHLYHTQQLGHVKESYAQIWHLYSEDRGITWTSPEIFYSTLGGWDRNRIIPTFDKEGLIFPCYNSTLNHLDYSFIFRRSTSTSKFIRINMTESDNLVQPTIIRLDNSEKLRAFFRDRRFQCIYYSDSNDDGLTWTIPKATVLPNNNAAIQAYTLKSGAIIMAFDNLNGTKRSPLTVALSYDNGMTWPYHRDVQIHDDDNSTFIGEYSYPSILQTSWTASDDNDIHLVYTYDRQTIKYVRFHENWVKQQQQ
ncbi:unnamed protein product [Adineta ricciae]|uniref:Sialidase domain-containing protein n=1 Tax=Adineta ricciae TaxID=249248 RepID=A0A815AAK1_ADIRI|nr:unnamed protein product [Adineta ricciae]CAF1254867.1 unnamed protein product [Adineta ricciae]